MNTSREAAGMGGLKGVFSEQYDYVIVGGGSAGCVLAARLSEDPAVSVCLIEAGPPDRHPLIHMPLGILWMMRSRTLNWNYATEPEPELGGRRLFWPRGRTLGGSSSSNAMCYLRGHPADYDAWAADGNPGWSFAEVLPYFLRAENQERGASAFHGVGGPLNVADLRTPSQLTPRFVAAGIEAGLAFNDDFNGESQEGVGPFQVTQKNGRRCSTARGYLAPALARPNLHVLTGMRATRLLFNDRRVVGVDCVRLDRPTVHQRLGARAEVLLAAGAIETPKLLMLSGIGETTALATQGIAVRHHLPGVGQNLQDHLDVLIVQRCTEPISWGITWRNTLRGGVDLWRYLFAGRGMFTTNGAEACIITRSSPDLELPDLQFHFTPGKLRDHGRDLGFLCGDGYSLHVCNLRPKSRGELVLASADPAAAPVIRARYLSDPDDLDRLVRGLRLGRRILATRTFDSCRGEEIYPGANVDDSDEALRAFVRSKAETIYHPVGTCKMGDAQRDPMAVVDAELRVHGIAGLRVVDASIMPTLVGGNTNAPTIMIAEKAIDLIRAAVPK